MFTSYRSVLIFLPRAGFSTIEILIAFSIGITFIAAAIMISYSDTSILQKNNLGSGAVVTLDAALDNQGLSKAVAKLEQIIAALVNDWKVVALGDSDGFYSNSPTTIDISPCLKELTNVTAWESGKRRRHVAISTLIGDVAAAKTLGLGNCDPTPPSSWSNPTDPDWQTGLGEISGLPTDLDFATINNTPYVFVVTRNTTQVDDLWVVDVSLPEEPRVVNSLETGDVTHTAGLSDMSIVTTDSGTYVYVLQKSADNQLQVIDVSDPESSLVTTTVSLSDYGVDPVGSDPEPTVIIYYGGRLYVGLQTTIGPELLVFDVTDNPTNPNFVGAIDDDFNHSINDIVVSGDYAYLAIAPGSVTTKELMIIDVSSEVPVDTGYGFNANLHSGDTEAATALYLLGNTLYLGRERVNNSAEKDFYSFDISAPLNPVVLKTKRLGISTGFDFGTPRVVDLVVQGRTGFFITTDSSKSLQIYDVVSDPNDIIPVAAYCHNFLSLPKLVKVIYRGNLIYGVSGESAVVNIIHDDANACIN